ncbi:8-amino-7-oxononanoate synthase [Labrys okinawensis]|uniref:8-amino-7-oxononanoate synthase n=1 Tax=Labrys okinawensis TaxID=346911 RepID=A0A2S9QBS0_9HYPH|nr:8-amino-7-oxononanoate synthase [Labrys okinawensis]PRH86791.1 8-amino-7-oxononanoate synthase [Labrys okinawensis]
MSVALPGEPPRLARYAARLRQFERKGRRRVLAPQSGVDFTSNDYLGLASSSRLREAVVSAVDRGVPAGAGGSRLLRGNHPEHEALEVEAAGFFGSERMLYFNGGYAANLAALSTLPQRGDLIVHDALIHASAHAGIAAGRARAVAVPHNDVAAVEQAIRAWRAGGGSGHPWIVVESLYSMDGDIAPLAELMALADAHDGFLYVDEAHATGVHGLGGRGFAAALEGRDNVVVLHTCGKALGSSGALIGASAVLCDVLVNHAAPFIYATAPSPFQAALVREALRALADEPERRERELALIAFANRLLAERLGIAGSGSQILPVVIGDNERCLAIAERMQAAGFDIRAIRPPTVPAGTARLRISITANVDEEVIAQMVEHLAMVMVDN